MSFEPTEVAELLQVNRAAAEHLGGDRARLAAELQTKRTVGAEAWQWYRQWQAPGRGRDRSKLTDIRGARSNRRRTAAAKPST